MGKKKKEKRVKVNKYENAPRGPKRPGRNKGVKQSIPIEELVQDSSPIKESQKQLTNQQQKNQTYWQYDDWEVERTFTDRCHHSDKRGKKNTYASNKVNLVLYDSNARLCLLVGAWNSNKLFRKQMKKFREETGSIVEPYDNQELGIRTALTRSTNPEEIKDYLSPNAEVVIGIPKGVKGSNLLISHDQEGSNGQHKLNTILLHYLQKANSNYFNI
jgi:hypothetical protein